MKVLIALPAYNEQASIARIINNILDYKKDSKYNIEILVVNDGSWDKTEDIVKEIKQDKDNIYLVNHGINRGLGQAVSTILSFAMDNLAGDDVLVTMDADNTHSPILIEKMVDRLVNEGLDMVVASRFTKGGKEVGLSLPRKIYSRGAKYFFKIFFPIPNLNDYSCGFRAYRVKVLVEASKRWGSLITTNGFDCMAEIAAKLSKMKIKVGEVPLVLRYDLKEGDSKMRVFKTIKGYFSLIYKVR